MKLLRVEPDKDYNRTVVTFVGDPAAVVKAAFQAMRTAAELKEATPPSPVEAGSAIGDDSSYRREVAGRGPGTVRTNHSSDELEAL